ncbi:MAG TPA: hypothetical protein VNE41_00915 [Chitinophagaceae bacterium]|nr:hypothetical protein [Chitinophagaceae bacterium]
MDMTLYLTDTFRFNDLMNKKLLNKIAVLADPQKSIVLFSHLINCQYKWMARICQEPKVNGMSWWDPVYAFEDLPIQWDKSLIPWINFIKARTEEELYCEVEFTGYDGGTWVATPADIALQLNYHSIHHRAQIQTIIRGQGLEPDFVDYIGIRWRKISG